MYGVGEVYNMSALELRLKYFGASKKKGTPSSMNGLGARLGKKKSGKKPKRRNNMFLMGENADSVSTSDMSFDDVFGEQVGGRPDIFHFSYKTPSFSRTLGFLKLSITPPSSPE